MRKNNFSSAADRRWQRRYERIQQRKEEERERLNARGKDDPDDYFGFPTLSQQEAQRILDSFNGLGNIHAVPPSEIEQYFLLREEQMELDRREQQMFTDERSATSASADDYYCEFVERSFIFDDEPQVSFAGRLREIMRKYWGDWDEKQTPEPEPDLDAGDSLALDSFLGEFLAPGV